VNGSADAVQAGRYQPVALRFALILRRLQLVAQRHQFIDLGDDAVLFGEAGNAIHFACSSWAVRCR
jgi:hypothetical protein